MSRPRHPFQQHIGAGLASLVLASALMAGCAPAVPSSTTVAEADRTLTVRGKVALRQGGYGLRQAVLPYDSADVEKIKVYLRRGEGEEFFIGEHGDVNAPIVIGNLRMDTEYAVRLEAFTTEGEVTMRIDAGDERCVTTFTTSNQLEEAGLIFGLALENKIFAGQASGTLAIEPGGIEGPLAQEQVVLTAQPAQQAQLHGYARVHGAATADATGNLTLPAGDSSAFVVPGVAFPAPGSYRYYRVTFDEATIPPDVRITFMVDSEAALADGMVTGHPALELMRGTEGEIFVKHTKVDDDFSVIHPAVAGPDFQVPHFGASVNLGLSTTDGAGILHYDSDVTMLDGLGEAIGWLPSFVKPATAPDQNPLPGDAAMYLRFENLGAADVTIRVESIVDSADEPAGN